MCSGSPTTRSRSRIWSRPWVSVDKLAYTTILTVVTHLFDKGWVSREKKSRAYFYRPSRSREEATSRALRELLDSSSDSAAVLLHFAKTMTDAENEALRRGLSGEGVQ